MKNFRIFVLAAVFLMGYYAAQAAAEIKITVKNNRSHKLSFAFCWQGFDVPDNTAKGWYNVDPGKSKTITLKNAVYALTAQGFGYYAQGGGKVWKGNEGDEYMTFWIHPKKSFTSLYEEFIPGGRKAEFRKIKLTKVGDDNEDGKATLTFNP